MCVNYDNFLVVLNDGKALIRLAMGGKSGYGCLVPMWVFSA